MGLKGSGQNIHVVDGQTIKGKEAVFYISGVFCDPAFFKYLTDLHWAHFILYTRNAYAGLLTTVLLMYNSIIVNIFNIFNIFIINIICK